jgi:hypothetical protein
MTNGEWTLADPQLADDEALASLVVHVHRELLRGPMASEVGINPALEIQARAFRCIEGWRVMLLLTPWMLARLQIPDVPLPDGWNAAERDGAPYQVLGPALQLELLGKLQSAHLSYHPGLGHYLLQPICLDMLPYSTADAVFEEWNRVIHVRDENMEKARRNCPMQREISRRELFTGSGR